MVGSCDGKDDGDADGIKVEGANDGDNDVVGVNVGETVVATEGAVVDMSERSTLLAMFCSILDDD